MVLYPALGVLRYGYTNLVLDVDPGIVTFYRSLIPKYHTIQPQMYEAHISVVRKEVPPNMECWRKHEGERVEFVYSNEICHENVYWWLNAFSVRLEEIRQELGLRVDAPFIQPPAGFLKTFHITLANSKGLL